MAATLHPLGRALVQSERAMPARTVRQLAALIVLGSRREPFGTSELSAALGVDKPVVSRLVDTMQDMIDDRPNPHDRRCRLITLSARGRRFVDGVMAAAREVQS